MLCLALETIIFSEVELVEELIILPTSYFGLSCLKCARIYILSLILAWKLSSSLCLLLDKSIFFILRLSFILFEHNQEKIYLFIAFENLIKMVVFFSFPGLSFLNLTVLSLISGFQMTNTIQKKYKVSSTQLLYQSCPYQATTLLISGPFLDKLLTNQSVFAFKYTTQVTVFIILSCLISISVNFSTFLVIGKTSPVTYQVLGHLKTCLVLAFGYILLRDPFSWRNILGISIAMVGMILYSYYCNLENQQKAVEAASQSSQAREGESDPLVNVEKGSAIVSDTVGQRQMSPIWSKSKDQCVHELCYRIAKNSYSPYRGLTLLIHMELGSGSAAKRMAQSFF